MKTLYESILDSDIDAMHDVEHKFKIFDILKTITNCIRTGLDEVNVDFKKYEIIKEKNLITINYDWPVTRSNSIDIVIDKLVSNSQIYNLVQQRILKFKTVSNSSAVIFSIINSNFNILIDPDLSYKLTIEITGDEQLLSIFMKLLQKK